MAESSGGGTSDDEQDDLDISAEQEIGSVLGSVDGIVVDQGVSDVAAAGTGDGNSSSRTGRVMVVSGKRPADMMDTDQDGEETVRKRTRTESWDEDSLEDMDLDYDADKARHRSVNSDDDGTPMVEHGQILGVPQQLRRKFYFEGDTSSSNGSDYEEEPTSHLVMLRRKKEYNKARSQALRLRREKSNSQTPEAASISEETTKRYRGKALATFNSQYLDLLNQAISDAKYRKVYPDISVKSSEVGGVFWSIAEKQRFFRALPRLGRHNAVGLSEEIESKTPIEVQGYLDELRRETDRRMQQNVGVRRHTLLMMEDIPAAIEVSDECVEILDKEAERVALHLAKWEKKEWKEKFGDFEDSVNAEQAKDMNVAKPEDGDRKPEDESLIDSRIWLKLAERIFMASEYNKDSDRPAIHKQTLEDLETLVKSITRRVVHISLFQAHSRLKNCAVPRYGNTLGHPVVELRDVAAAMKILGMPTTSEEYWRHVPRRFKLRVFVEAKPGKGKKPEFMGYDQVEEELKVFEKIHIVDSPGITDSSPLVSTSATDSTSESNDGWESDDEDEELDQDQHGQAIELVVNDVGQPSNGDSGVNGARRRNKSEMAKYLETPLKIERYLPTSPIRPLTSRQRKEILDELHFINEDEEYLNAVDSFYSLREEKKLWKILGGWKERRSELNARLEEVEASIPSEPALAGWRRLEKWKRQEWRDPAEDAMPIWQQPYYGKLREKEKLQRVKSGKSDSTVVSTTTKDDIRDLEVEDDTANDEDESVDVDTDTSSDDEEDSTEDGESESHAESSSSSS